MDGRATGGVLRAGGTPPRDGGILRFFRDVPDPRASNVVHKLHDILVLAICGVICGADGWVEVAEFANSKLAWFRTFLELPGGVPSHDTFGRVFARLDPDAFERRFTAWVAAVAGASGGRLVAIDGKAIRRSFEHAWDRSGMAHLVSAFVDANRMVFGQVAVAGKSNEIEAIPRLLALLDLAGATVTVDAIGCQRAVAREVDDRGGRYVLAVKENQPALYAKVKALLDGAVLDGFDGMRHGYREHTDGGHGRVETRRVWVTDEVNWLGGELLGQWAGLGSGSIAVVESVRQDLGDLTGQVTTERRYFISSLPGTDADRMAEAVRGHWAVENKLHWQLDVSFREDERRIRKGHGAENYSRLCRLALNLLKRDKSVKIGVHGKRLKAGWDEHYLLRLLTG
jgi:predicted transposase YbfD/YdcC